MQNPKTELTVPQMRARAKALAVPALPIRQRSEITGWNADRILGAISSADSGSMRELGDFVAVLLADDRVTGVLQTRTHGLLGMPLDFIAGDEGFKDLLRGSDSAPGLWYLNHPEPELAAFLADAIVMGIGLAQRIPTQWGYRLERWDPGDLVQVQNTDGSFRWQVQTIKGLIDLDPGQWIIHCPYGSMDPWKRGMWRSLMLPWLLKRLALEDRASGSEQAGLQAPIIEAPEGSTETQRKQVAAQFSDEARKLAIVLPAGWKATYLQPANKIFEIYSEAVAWADLAITITLAGQVVTTEGSPGFSSGNVQDQIRVDLIRYDAEALSYTLHDQSLVWFARESGLPDTAAPWPVWNTSRPLDREALARTIEQLGRGVAALDQVLVGHDLRVDLPRLCELMLIPTVAVSKKSTDVQAALLNGAQITAIVDIVTKVAAREMPRSSGVALLVSTLQVEPTAAERIIGDSGTPSFQVAPSGPSSAPPALPFKAA
jgi:hypothetical protein